MLIFSTSGNTMKTKSFFTLLLCLIVFVTTVSGQQERPENLTEYIVISDTANLRTGAGTNFAVAGTVTKGDKLLIYTEEPEVEGWLRIYREGEDNAYIADFLVERAPVQFYSASQ